MLNDTLVTNEVKGTAGTEIEFQRLSTEGRSTEFAKVGELPGNFHRLIVSHQEVGTGASRRRRSRIAFELTALGADGVTPVKNSAYIVIDIPIGNLTTYDDTKTVLANLMSLLATTGAATTVLFDCTGNGAKALIDGSL